MPLLQPSPLEGQGGPWPCTLCNLCMRLAAWPQCAWWALATRCPGCRRRSLRHTPLLSVTMVVEHSATISALATAEASARAAVCTQPKPAPDVLRPSPARRTPLSPMLLPSVATSQPPGTVSSFPRSPRPPSLGCLVSAATLPGRCPYSADNPASTVHPLTAARAGSR